MQKVVSLLKNINLRLQKCFVKTYNKSLGVAFVNNCPSDQSYELTNKTEIKKCPESTANIVAPIILAISGDSKNVDVCLTKGNELLKAIAIDGSSASKLLVCTIERLLVEAGLKVNDLSYVAVNVGPGSFTSTRVLVVVANAIAWACKIPIIPVNSFETLLEKHSLAKDSICNNAQRICVLNAYSSQVYGAVFDNKNNSITEPLCTDIDKFKARINSDFGVNNTVWLVDGVSKEKLSMEQEVFQASSYKDFQSTILAKIAFEKLLKNPSCCTSKVSIDYIKEGFV